MIIWIAASLAAAAFVVSLNSRSGVVMDYSSVDRSACIGPLSIGNTGRRQIAMTHSARSPQYLSRARDAVRTGSKNRISQGQDSVLALLDVRHCVEPRAAAR